MRIPKRYRELQETRWAFPFSWDEDGHPETWPTAFAYYYPPPGFLPIGLFEPGDGDKHSFYWPVGREEDEPLLCETYHDSQTIEPHAYNLEGLVKLKILSGWYKPDDLDYKEAVSIARQLSIKLPNPSASAAPSPFEMLELDDASPAALRTAALSAVKEQHFEQAEQYLTRALHILPEYTAALFALAVLYRRMQRLSLAVPKMLEVLSAPRCFGPGRDACLRWLQQYSDEDFPELTDGPLWRQRHALTFETGVKYNTDFLIYEDAIQDYLRSGKAIFAVRLRILVRDLM